MTSGSPPAMPSIPGAPAAFHLLAKPTGAVCNLDCAYCFFLSKEMLYPGSRFRMADDMLEAYVRQLVEAHAGAPVVEVAWQGGEPTLMGLAFFRRAVELVDTYLHPGQRAVYTIHLRQRDPPAAARARESTAPPLGGPTADHRPRRDRLAGPSGATTGAPCGA